MYPNTHGTPPEEMVLTREMHGLLERLESEKSFEVSEELHPHASWLSTYNFVFYGYDYNRIIHGFSYRARIWLDAYRRGDIKRMITMCLRCRGLGRGYDKKGLSPQACPFCKGKGSFDAEVKMSNEDQAENDEDPMIIVDLALDIHIGREPTVRAVLKRRSGMPPVKTGVSVPESFWNMHHNVEKHVWTEGCKQHRLYLFSAYGFQRDASVHSLHEANDIKDQWSWVTEAWIVSYHGRIRARWLPEEGWRPMNRVVWVMGREIS